MKRRELLKHCLLALGVSATGAVSAFDVGRALSGAKSLSDAATISDKDINAYFSQMAQETDKQNKIAPANSSYGKRLTKLTQGLSSHDGLKLNFKVYETKEVNAFAMGDGTVRIYSGLMDMMTDDEVRYVIGHEIGHIKAGHSKKRMQMALTTSGLRDVAASSGSKVATLADSQLGELFQQVILAQHSQSNENEADDYAMAFLKGKKYDPRAAVTALEKLDKLSGGGGASWLSTHPAPAERAERMRKQLG